jgi:TIGR03009 family protein
MTRAIRSVFATAGLVVLFGAAADLAAQNVAAPSRYAPQGQQSGQAAPAGQQPARASVYGPATGAPAAQPNRPQPQQGQPYQVQPAQARTEPAQQQPGQVRPANGQMPIRQPGLGNAAAPGAGGPLDVPRAAVVSPPPLQPEWFPLDPKVQVWVDQVLAYWEKRSDQVKTLECTFQKWEYDPQYVADEFNRLKNLNQLHLMPFAKYAAGTIKYAAPDKGLFHVTSLQVIAPPKPGAKPAYAAQPPENGEHWVTDGKRVFAFDAIKKEVIESLLPPEMQGKSLADGPLPFMFGARAETIKARYWIRPLQAENAGEYCLEAVPKSRQDSANFKTVQIVLDEKEYLPIRMQIFDSDWSPNNPHRTAYKFDNRTVNAPNHIAKILDPLDLWTKQFYEVKTPSGWKRIVHDASGNIVGPGGANTATAPLINGPVPR